MHHRTVHYDYYERKRWVLFHTWTNTKAGQLTTTNKWYTLDMHIKWSSVLQRKHFLQQPDQHTQNGTGNIQWIQKTSFMRDDMVWGWQSHEQLWPIKSSQKTIHMKSPQSDCHVWPTSYTKGSYKESFHNSQTFHKHLQHVYNGAEKPKGTQLFRTASKGA